MHVYRHGSEKNHGTTPLARISTAPRVLGKPLYGSGLITVRFSKSRCRIGNLGGTYTVYVDLEIKDIRGILDSLVEAAENREDQRDEIAAQLEACRESLAKLAALSHGYGPMPQREAKDD